MFQDDTLYKLTYLLLSHVKVESYSLEMVRRDVGVNVTEILSSSSGVRCDADRCDRWLVNRRTLDASSISIQVPQPTLFTVVSVTVKLYPLNDDDDDDDNESEFVKRIVMMQQSSLMRCCHRQNGRTV